MMKISATEQTCSASEKLPKGILNMPSEPNTIPRTIKINNVGTPSRPESRLPAIQTKIMIATTKSANEVEICISPFLYTCPYLHTVYIYNTLLLCYFCVKFCITVSTDSGMKTPEPVNTYFFTTTNLPSHALSCHELTVLPVP